jgi:hypothetical protein
MTFKLQLTAKPCISTRGPKHYAVYNQVAMKILISLLTFTFMRLEIGWGGGCRGGGEGVCGGGGVHPEKSWAEASFNLFVLASSWSDVLL